MLAKFLVLAAICVGALAQQTSPAPIVPILLELDDATRAKVEAILIDQNLSQNEINQQVDAIFAQQSPSIASQYNVTKQAYETAVAELERQHAEKIKSASFATQMADTEIRKIANDNSLTGLQQNRAIFQIFQSQTPEVQKELNEYAIFKRN